MIIQQIDKAKESIDVAMYFFTSGPLAQALVRAEKRGVEVRAYLDPSQKTGRYSRTNELLAGGAEVKFKDGAGLMHNKFCVIDSRVLITGSYNWTKAAEEKNDENILVIVDKEVVGAFGKRFGEYWRE